MDQFSAPHADFDESLYLKLNPDVAAAVRDGQFSSGWCHYVMHGSAENRSIGSGETLGQNFSPPDWDGGEPLPPPQLRKRVHGSTGIVDFDRIGKMIAFDIVAALPLLPGAGENLRILDFGCGCGRVMRHLRKLVRSARFHGCDIDPEAISWCREHLAPVGSFDLNQIHPPLSFGDDYFDITFSISVFTHLPEAMEHAWLAELRRVTKPGGLVLLTSHGEDELKPLVSSETFGRFQESGFYYHVTGCGTEGLPDFYQTSFHTENYIRNRWSKYFAIEAFSRRRINYHQDLILCRK